MGIMIKGKAISKVMDIIKWNLKSTNAIPLNQRKPNVKKDLLTKS